jgi:imidazolonepropionase-like amidohydrolase
MLEAGVRCIIATDAGIGPAKPHDVLARTVEHAVDDLGAMVDEALTMCTARAAQAIGLGDRAGRLRAGVSADLLVVSGRVDQDASAMRNPVRVLRGGVTV